MINSIRTIESNNSNAFGAVTSKSDPRMYWIMPETMQDIYENKKKKENSKLHIINPEEARKTNNIKLIGISIASVTVLTAAGIFFLLKGGTKGLSKNFQRLRDFFDKKVQTSKLENPGQLSFSGKSYIFIVKTLDNMLKKFEAVNNFTTIKDLLFKKIMFNNFTGKYTGKVHDSITLMFERIGRQSVVNSYNKTSGKFRFAEVLSEEAAKNIMRGNSYEVIEINGLRQTKAQWLSQLGKMNNELRANYEKYFSQDPLRARYYRFKKSAEDLKAAFSKLRVFWSKDLWTTFMAEAAMLDEKSAVQKIVRNNRHLLSHSLSDMAKDSNALIMKMTESISFKDAEKISHLRNIKAAINEYAKKGGNLELKEKIINGMDVFASNIRSALSDNTMDEKLARGLLNDIAELKNNFLNFKQGQIEDMLDIYKNILPQDEYNNLEKAYKASVKSLDKSIHMETEEFVSKLRDLVLGSAPTDILTILGSLGVLGYQLGKSDDNDQRLSISLKYGIPALAGIGISLYCNAKLYAGTKSLIIGTLSSLIINKFGVWADNIFKTYKLNQQSQANDQTGDKTSPTSGLSLAQNPPKTV